MINSKPNKPNAPDQPEAPRSRGCWIWLFFLFIGVPLCLILSVVLLLFAREQSAQSRVRDRIEALRKQGMPYDAASLDSYYKGLTDDRDAIAWVKALDRFGSPTFEQSTSGVAIFDKSGELSVGLPGTDWPSETASRKFLRQWDGLLQELQMLAQQQLDPNSKPPRFPIQWNGFKTELRYEQYMRSAARLLDLSGRTALRDGDSNGVRTSIEGLMGCGQALAGEPTLVGQLIRVAVDGIAVGLLRTAVEQDALSERDLSRLLELLKQRTDLSDGMKIALTGERAIAIPVFSNPREVGSEFAYLPTRSRDLLNYLELSTELIDLPSDDLNQFLLKAEFIEKRIENRVSANLLEQFDSILTMQTIPATGAVSNAFVRRCALNRLATLAVAVRLHQKRNAMKFPATLDELASMNLNVAQIRPTGPKPYGYRVEENARAILWGPPYQGGVHSNLATPDLPPTINPELGDNDPVQMWIWTLENTKSR